MILQNMCNLMLNSARFLCDAHGCITPTNFHDLQGPHSKGDSAKTDCVTAWVAKLRTSSAMQLPTCLRSLWHQYGTKSLLLLKTYCTSTLTWQVRVCWIKGRRRRMFNDDVLRIITYYFVWTESERLLFGQVTAAAANVIKSAVQGGSAYSC